MSLAVFSGVGSYPARVAPTISVPCSAKADVRLSSLRNRSRERVLAEIVCGNCLEAWNGFAFRHGFLIGRQRSSRCRILVYGDRHFLRAIAIRVDIAPCRLGIGDRGQVVPGTRFPRYFGKEMVHRA